MAQASQHAVTQGGKAYPPRSSLTPGLAAAAKRFGIRPDAVKRHEEIEQKRTQEFVVIQAERDAHKASYEALKQTVDQLVVRLQDVAKAPAQAQSGDIKNIRTLLKQAYLAMERQQVELKGIRARTQRMERAALRADEAQLDVRSMREEMTGYQSALHGVRKDMSELMEFIEGDGGLKDLESQLRVMRTDVEDTRKRTKTLEDGLDEQSARTAKLESDMANLQVMMDSNMKETAGVAGALLTLREEVGQLNQKFVKYVIEQMRFTRKNSL